MPKRAIREMTVIKIPIYAFAIAVVIIIMYTGPALSLIFEHASQCASQWIEGVIPCIRTTL
jgi:hypothetical protein